MSNSTDVFWSVNGVSLQTYAFNVTTLASKYKTPKLRGDDRKYAYKPGAAFRKRQFDSDGVQLGMWVLGADENGGVPASMEAQFRTNMRKLQELFVDPDGGEFALTKRWHDEVTGAVVSATGHGVLPDGLAPAMEGGPHRAKVVADVHMADPFFYGDPVSVTVPLNTATAVSLPGDLPTTEIVVEFHGQLTNPLLTNSSLTPNVTMKLGTGIAVGDMVTADVDQTTVFRQNDGANIIGTLSHSGARPWMVLTKGSNVLTLTADGGAGSATVTYKPVWF